MDDQAAHVASSYGQQLKDAWDNARSRKRQAIDQAQDIMEPIREFLSALQDHTRTATGDERNAITLREPSVHFEGNIAEVTYPVVLRRGIEESLELRVKSHFIELIGGNTYRMPVESAQLCQSLAKRAFAFFKPE
jgi:hypothetical protein